MEDSAPHCGCGTAGSFQYLGICLRKADSHPLGSTEMVHRQHDKQKGARRLQHDRQKPTVTAHPTTRRSCLSSQETMAAAIASGWSSGVW